MDLELKKKIIVRDLVSVPDLCYYNEGSLSNNMSVEHLNVGETPGNKTKGGPLSLAAKLLPNSYCKAYSYLFPKAVQ